MCVCWLLLLVVVVVAGGGGGVVVGCLFLCLFVCAKIHALYPHHRALHGPVKHTPCLAQVTV